MRVAEFVRWLRSQGVQVSDGSKHLALDYKGNRSTLPRHPGKELATGTMHAVLKQLGLK